MVVSVLQGVVSKEHCQRFAGDYSTTECMLDLLMLIFLGSGYLFINVSESWKSSKQISIPVAFLNNSVKLYLNFSYSHDTTKLSWQVFNLSRFV